MKKKILIGIIISILVLSGCGNKESKYDMESVPSFLQDSEFFSIEKQINRHEYIIYDNNTKVKYYFYGFWGDEKLNLITPIYNSDGTMQIHE